MSYDPNAESHRDLMVELAEQDAALENYREAMAEAISMLRSDEQLPPTQIAQMLEEVLGLDGRKHLAILQTHEELVMGLMAFRTNALESLLPDTCPDCGMEARQHTQACRYGMAMTLIPEHMPPIEASAVFKLGVIAGQIREWSDEVLCLTGEGQGPAALIGHMREVASKL
jgi:hypothetical protein